MSRPQPTPVKKTISVEINDRVALYLMGLRSLAEQQQSTMMPRSRGVRDWLVIHDEGEAFLAMVQREFPDA